MLFLERLSPTLEHGDSSSGTLGTALNHGIEELVAIVASAPTDTNTRALARPPLGGHAAEAIEYVERLGDFWGDLGLGGDRLWRGQIGWRLLRDLVATKPGD